MDWVQNRLEYRSKTSVHIVTHHIDGFPSALPHCLIHGYLVCTEVAELMSPKKKTPLVLGILTNCLGLLFLSSKETFWLEE